MRGRVVWVGLGGDKWNWFCWIDVVIGGGRWGWGRRWWGERRWVREGWVGGEINELWGRGGVRIGGGKIGGLESV